MSTSTVIQTRLECPCFPGKTYASRSTFQKHFQSKRHENHRLNSNKTDLHRRYQELEIELRKTRQECQVWKEKYLELRLRTENIESLL
jgi:predicted RNase H-like nuclease (RuvC/YqgF family)